VKLRGKNNNYKKANKLLFKEIETVESNVIVITH